MKCRHRFCCNFASVHFQLTLNLLGTPVSTVVWTNLLRQFAVLVDVPHLLAAEVGGSLGAGAAVHGNVGVAAVVVAVARGGLALVHGVVLGGPLQGRQALGVPGERRTALVTVKRKWQMADKGEIIGPLGRSLTASLIFINLGRVLSFVSRTVVFAV